MASFSHAKTPTRAATHSFLLNRTHQVHCTSPGQAIQVSKSKSLRNAGPAMSQNPCRVCVCGGVAVGESPRGAGTPSVALLVSPAPSPASTHRSLEEGRAPLPARQARVQEARASRRPLEPSGGARPSSPLLPASLAPPGAAATPTACRRGRRAFAGAGREPKSSPPHPASGAGGRGSLGRRRCCCRLRRRGPDGPTASAGGGHSRAR